MTRESYFTQHTHTSTHTHSLIPLLCKYVSTQPNRAAAEQAAVRDKRYLKAGGASTPTHTLSCTYNHTSTHQTMHKNARSNTWIQLLGIQSVADRTLDTHTNMYTQLLMIPCDGWVR